MKKQVCIISAAVIFLALPLSAASDSGISQGQELQPQQTETQQGTVQAGTSGDGIDPRTGFPEIKAKPYVMFNEGAAFSSITRIIYQKDYGRSNFVWQNYLAGLYCEMQTGNMKPADSLARIAVYYPFGHTFNGMTQPPKQPLLYAFDAYYGPLFQADMWKYVRINFSLGPHVFYELSDEYHHLEAGGAVLVGLELPVATYWTIINNGMLSVDYGNIGSNRVIQPYDMVWHYQIELGVRFSIKGANEYAYIRQKPPKTRLERKAEKERRKKEQADRAQASEATPPENSTEQ